jgi:hypothetical protein
LLVSGFAGAAVGVSVFGGVAVVAPPVVVVLVVVADVLSAFPLVPFPLPQEAKKVARVKASMLSFTIFIILFFMVMSVYTANKEK